MASTIGNTLHQLILMEENSTNQLPLREMTNQPQVDQRRKKTRRSKWKPGRSRGVKKNRSREERQESRMRSTADRSPTQIRAIEVPRTNVNDPEGRRVFRDPKYSNNYTHHMLVYRGRDDTMSERGLGAVPDSLKTDQFKPERAASILHIKVEEELRTIADIPDIMVRKELKNAADTAKIKVEKVMKLTTDDEPDSKPRTGVSQPFGRPPSISPVENSATDPRSTLQKPPPFRTFTHTGGFGGFSKVTKHGRGKFKDGMKGSMREYEEGMRAYEEGMKHVRGHFQY